MLILFISFLIAALIAGELLLAGWRVQFHRRQDRQFTPPKNTFRKAS